MKKATVYLITLAAALSAPATVATAKPRPTPQQQLDKLLEGRVAGKPVSCIDTYINRDTRVIDKTAIVYGRGRTIFVNRPPHPELLRSDDVMVTALPSTRLCDVDVVRLHDRVGGWNRGFVGLGQFVPYTKVASPDPG